MAVTAEGPEAQDPLDPLDPVDPLARLIAAPQEVNPALIVAWRIKALEWEGKLGIAELIPLAGQIDDAREAGQKLLDETERAVAHLKAATPQPAPSVPIGF